MNTTRALLLPLLFVATTATAASIPARPYGAVWDGADALSGGAEARIASAAAQASTGEVMVATIHAGSPYGGGSIESLARQWFNAWDVGNYGSRSRSTGYGVLLLVAIDDREARIEIGKGWSSTARAATQDIMDNVIVPRMKSGDVDGAVEQGVRALAQLQSRRTSSSGIGSALDNLTGPGGTGVRSYSLMGGANFSGGIGIGIALLVLGVLLKPGRKWLLLGGVLVLFITVFTKVILVLVLILAVIFGSSGRRSRRYGSSRSSRRSGSSGRGATGRW